MPRGEIDDRLGWLSLRKRFAKWPDTFLLETFQSSEHDGSPAIKYIPPNRSGSTDFLFGFSQ
jgi:hypothetical protein